MATAEDVEQYLTLGHETRSFEVKGPGSISDKSYCAKIARAAMAMGNLHDGGLICLGIDESSMTAMKPGLDDEQLAAWSDFDNVADAIARFCDPPVTFHLLPFTLSSGGRVVVLEVDEFEVVPHICTRDYPGETQAGLLYVRPHGKPRSAHVPSASELRELLDLATTKGVREFVRRAALAGVMPTLRAEEDAEGDAFAAEAEAAWAEPSDLTSTLATAGYFDIAIRPRPFDAHRIRPADLQDVVISNAVRLRGWPLPMVDLHEPVKRHATWVGQDTQSTLVPHVEAWRLCTSGQFLQRRVLASDLSDARELRASSERATGAVAVWDVLLYLTEVAELAARLATAVHADAMTIQASINGIAGRELISGDWARELHGPYILDSATLNASAGVTTVDLLRDPIAVGIALTQDLLGQFGLNVTEDILREWQGQVFRR